MKKLIALILTAAMILTLIGCGTTPDETSQPTVPAGTTVPDPTIPETTQSVIPTAYVPAEEMLKGSVIEMTVEEDTILLSECDLTLEMTTGSNLVYRKGYVAAVMKSEPIIHEGVVYLHEDFFQMYLRREDSDTLSLFHGVLFHPDEVVDALEHPQASGFNVKLLQEVFLPSSMGIEIPRIDQGRIFQDTPLSQYQGLAGELKGYGYEGTFTYGEYTVIVNAQTLKAAGIADDTVTTVGEYNRQQREVDERMTDEQKAFMEEKQIQLADYGYLFKWFNGGFMEYSDEELRAALEECYKTDLWLMLEWEYREKHVEQQVREFYTEFIEVDLSDPVRAIEEYEYYKDESLKAIAIESVKGNYTTDYEILSVEKITDQLWAIELYIETSMRPEGFTAYNFVGKINGEYKVIRGVGSIPDELIGDLNLDAYRPTGDYMDPEGAIDQAQR